ERAIGVILFEPASGRSWIRLREKFDDIADPEDAEVLEWLGADLRARLDELGPEAAISWLEDCLSNSLRVSERRHAQVDAFTRVLSRLYSEHVEKIAVEPFRTHLPLFSLKAAAGGLGEE